MQSKSKICDSQIQIADSVVNSMPLDLNIIKLRKEKEEECECFKQLKHQETSSIR